MCLGTRGTHSQENGSLVKCCIHIGRSGQAVFPKGSIECLSNKWFTFLEVISSCELGTHIGIVQKSDSEPLLAECIVCVYIFTSSIGIDAASLAKLITCDFSIVVQTGHVGPQIIVLDVDSSTGIEVNVEVNVDGGDVSINTVGVSIIDDLDSFSEVDFGAVTAGDSGHLLHTATHWCTSMGWTYPCWYM